MLEVKREYEVLNSQISSLKTEKDSLQEKLNEVSNQLAATAEEKTKFEKLSEKLEKEKSEVENKSKQHLNKIEELIKLHEVGCWYFIVAVHGEYFSLLYTIRSLSLRYVLACCRISQSRSVLIHIAGVSLQIITFNENYIRSSGSADARGRLDVARCYSKKRSRACSVAKLSIPAFCEVKNEIALLWVVNRSGLSVLYASSKTIAQFTDALRIFTQSDNNGSCHFV